MYWKALYLGWSIRLWNSLPQYINEVKNALGFQKGFDVYMDIFMHIKTWTRALKRIETSCFRALDDLSQLGIRRKLPWVSGNLITPYCRVSFSEATSAVHCWRQDTRPRWALSLIQSGLHSTAANQHTPCFRTTWGRRKFGAGHWDRTTTLTKSTMYSRDCLSF